MSKRIRNDIILIISVLAITITLLVVFLLVRKTDSLYANIYKDDKIYESVSLNETKTITLDGKVSKITIIISNNEVYVSESGCPNKICVNTGKISHDKESIMCIPNGVYVIVGSKVA